MTDTEQPSQITANDFIEVSDDAWNLANAIVLCDAGVDETAALIQRAFAEREAELVGERFYIDCEFDGHGGSLMSIALVKDDGDGIHIQADVEPMDLWVRRNVLPLMDKHNAPKSAKVYLNEVGGVIRAFIGDCACPVIVADSPVDIGRFCQALSTASDGGWASADYPAMRFDVHNVDCYPTDLPGAVQHNAWWDAMALRAALKSREAGHG